MPSKPAFTFIDLFAGIGGFRIGLERVGGKCLFSSEIDKHAIATYERNFGEKPHGDIRKIEAADVPDHDLLCGGFPCQPFSVSGKQQGFSEARGTLFFEIMRIVGEKKPKAVFLENVANYVTHRKGETLRKTLGMLDEAGYHTWHMVLNASDYGVPQARKRLYIVGIRKDIPGASFSFPAPSLEICALRDLLLPNAQARSTIISRDDITITNPDPTRQLERRPNRPVQIGKINKGGQGERIYATAGHAITLSAHGGGAAAKTGAYLVDGIVRKLHPIECQRLMGFPADYKIDASTGQAWKQFGNAVVVDIIVAIGQQIAKALGWPKRK